MLFLARGVLERVAGPPPSNGVAILAWVERDRLALSLVSEVLFFAAMALVPAVIALYHSLVETARARVATGSGIMAVTIPVMAMSLIGHGRLVYPIYGIRISSPAIAENVVAVFYGGMHAAGLMLAIATVVLSLAMMRGVYGKRIAYLGFGAAAFDVAGAYPDVIGPALTLVCQAVFAAWFVAVGSKLYGLARVGEGWHGPNE
jgi:hypothetical protein